MKQLVAEVSLCPRIQHILAMDMSDQTHSRSKTAGSSSDDKVVAESSAPNPHFQPLRQTHYSPICSASFLGIGGIFTLAELAKVLLNRLKAGAVLYVLIFDRAKVERDEPVEMDLEPETASEEKVRG